MAGTVVGTIAPGFERVREVLERQIAEGEHVGAAVAAYHKGAPVVDLWGGLADEAGGRPWRQDSISVVFSTTKGLAATCLHMLVERGKLSYDDPVCKHWPQFAKNGKEAITVRHVLTHQAGIPQQPEGLDHDQMLDWETMVHAVEDLTPLWKPGAMSGYHPYNIGWIVGELVRRVDGRTIGTFLREEVAGPLGLRDLHIGLPPEKEGQVAPLHSLIEENPALQAQIEQWINPNTIAGKALPRWMSNALDFMNTPEAHRAEIPAAGGIAAARDLARLYACLGNGGSLDGVTIMRPETIAAATVRQTYRPDATLIIPIGWALGYMTGGAIISVSGPRETSFGHAGFGGSNAFADPEIGLAFAYVPNGLVLDLVGDPRAFALAQAARDCASA